MSSSMSNLRSERARPVLIELDAPPPSPSEAPPVPEAATLPAAEGAAVARALRLAAGRPAPLARLLWASAGGLLALALALALWDWVAALLARSPLLGGLAAALLLALLVALALVALREGAGFARLARLDGLRAAAAAAGGSGDLAAARRVAGRIRDLYAGRTELRWGLARFAEREAELLDADALLAAAETELLAPLDAAARAEVEAAARRVAAATALLPVALADIAVALAANLRMIRRVAEIYGGRAGALGSWRIARAVFAHILATGLVAVGDDLLSSVAGGGLLSKLSRRFGEGVVNGALTVRVGLAAMEVCRPLPFRAAARPRLAETLGRALAGLFERAGAERA